MFDKPTKSLAENVLFICFHYPWQWTYIAYTHRKGYSIQSRFALKCDSQYIP